MLKNFTFENMDRERLRLLRSAVRDKIDQLVKRLLSGEMKNEMPETTDEQLEDLKAWEHELDEAYKNWNNPTTITVSTSE